ncbi:MAG TPA: sulfite exporter TauE/SafE family protein [Stellaceae bacterium]
MLSYILLMLAAFTSGVLNAIAGGGAFITFPALLFAGVPPVGANATSTVALFPGQAASAWAYRQDIGDVREVSVIAFVVLSLIGGLIGALLLLFTSNAVFARLVPWLLLFATLVFAAGNFMGKGVAAGRVRLGHRGVLVTQFLISIYGGYFGGGIGFLMLAALTLFGMRDIHAMNGLKILLATLMNGAAVIAFAIAGIVHWPETLAMAAASVVGGYVGALGAKRVDQRVIKGCVIALGAALTVYFFWHG